MVAAEGDDAGEGSAVFGGAFFVGIGEGLAHEEGVVAFFDLLDGVRIVVSKTPYQHPSSTSLSPILPAPSSPFSSPLELPPKAAQQINQNRQSNQTPSTQQPGENHSRGHRNIPTVQNLGPAIKRVRSQRHIISAAEPDFA